MTTETPVLMSSENHEGWKLGELCRQLQKEMYLKSAKIATDGTFAAGRILASNEKIIHLLEQIADEHEQAMDYLEAKVGPNQGPAGTPRIGEGSEPPKGPDNDRE